MVVFAGQGDARRSLSLLWGTEPAEQTRPGPKPALTAETIAAAAIELADEKGMAALSMRAVGERLGRTAMALYTYVPGKSELIDLMYDRAHAELSGDYPADDGWRGAVTAWAEDLWRFYQRHPWLLQVSQVRPVQGPHEFAVLEKLLTILDTSGLSAAVLRRVVGTLFHFVRGAAQTVAEARLAARSTGVSNDDWWHSRAAVMAEVVPDFAERFPTLVRLGRDDTFQLDPGRPYLEQQAEETFAVGLTVLLDGIESAVARSS
ncbi:TetR/AcrR family transcriptional regulator C-terminal domain-containing protein [Amycolatopsis suaedae]|uniref:TetR family transcriptional regulator n=1 Tax=Amycolatopsis suaedae TaxID=2510978 RepID=A0A4Q7J510_9PSEU|nr:TetR/AcrR family transcriptional regulator C-terminal domain-containing protein [Amycolatopsis suaedae]RZQ61898.1 TetR family transcriptional regulator [Amycolatopsis suaedae]